MDFFGFTISPEMGLWGMFLVAFASATLLPGGSEVVLLALLHKDPALFWPAVGAATAGNTLGGMTSYWIGRLLPNKAQGKAITWLQRYSYPALLMSWLPLFGDALCVAAGWLRMNVWVALVLFALGKSVRYLVVGGGFNWLQSFFAA